MPGCLASRGTGLLSEAETEEEKRSLITLADPRFCKSVSVNVMNGGRKRHVSSRGSILAQETSLRSKLRISGKNLDDSVLPASFSDTRCRIDLLDAPEIANFAQQ